MAFRIGPTRRGECSSACFAQLSGSVLVGVHVHHDNAHSRDGDLQRTHKSRMGRRQPTRIEHYDPRRFGDDVMLDTRRVRMRADNPNVTFLTRTRRSASRRKRFSSARRKTSTSGCEFVRTPTCLSRRGRGRSPHTAVPDSKLERVAKKRVAGKFHISTMLKIDPTSANLKSRSSSYLRSLSPTRLKSAA